MLVEEKIILKNESKRINIVLFRLHRQRYVQVMKESLMRHKILLIFFSAIFAPSLSSLYSLIMLPMVALVSTSTSLCHKLIIFSVYQVVGLIGVVVHRPIFANQPWAKFFISLPLSLKNKFFITIQLLVFSNVILCAPLLFAIFIAAKDVFYQPVVMLQITINCLLVLLSIFIVQFLFLNKIYLVNALTSFFYHKRVNDRAADMEISCSFISRKKNCFYLHYKSACWALSNIQFKNIYFLHRQQLYVLLVMWVGVFAVAALLLFHVTESLLFKLIVSSVMFINALIVSYLFSYFLAQRQVYRQFLVSLPLSTLMIAKSDIAIAMGFLIACNTAWMGIVLCLAQVNSLAQLIMSFFLSMIFLLISYYPQIKYTRYGHLIAFILMCLFLWCYQIIFIAN